MIASRKSVVESETELDQALVDPEGFLSQSLQTQDRHRRRRIIRAAGIALLMLVGVLALELWPTPASAGAQSSKKTAEAHQLWKERKLEDAELAYLDAIRLNEDDTSAWNGLGWVRNNQGKHDEAIDAFRHCLALNEDHGGAVNGMGQSLLAKQDYKTAHKWLLKGTEDYFRQIPETRISETSIPAALFGLIQASLLLEKYDEAEKWSNKLLKYSPDNSQGNKFLEAAKSKDNSTIKAQIESLIKRQETAKNWKAAPATAIQRFRDMLQEDENDVVALNGLGFMLANTGQHEEAKPLFERCIKLNAKHFGALNGLARCYKSAGNTKEAIRIWQEIVDKVKVVNAATVGLAYAYIETKDFEKALPLLNKLVAAKTEPVSRYQALLTKVESELETDK